ncbi:SHOCT domain-containing protein [Rhodococcus sp. NPDC057529]|uniref:SHOCT domain-containing protein n=1 Tax=Rhodococcus sp. NPDC057529 TaxID=3346158 RepID=UPI00366D8E9D
MPGLLRGIARTAVVAGTATAVSNRVSRRQGQRWAANQPAPQQQSPPPPPPPPAQPAPQAVGTDRIAALKQLGELRDQGVLTEEEFNAEKAKILAS